MSVENTRNPPANSQIQDASAIAHAHSVNTLVNLRRAAFGTALSRAEKKKSEFEEVAEDLGDVPASLGGIAVNDPKTPVSAIQPERPPEDSTQQSAADLWSAYAVPRFAQAAPQASTADPNTAPPLAAIRVNLSGTPEEIQIAARGTPAPADTPAAAAPEPAPVQQAQTDQVAEEPYIRPFGLGDIDFS